MLRCLQGGVGEMQDEGAAVGQAGHTTNLLPTEEDSICSGRSSECRAGTSGATRRK